MTGALASLSELAAGLLAALGLGPGQPPPALGYVEADYLYLAPACRGSLVAVEVGDGDSVRAGDPLFQVDDARRAATLAAAEARLARSQAQRRDRLRGERPEELAVIEQELAGARAERADARAAFARSKNLAARQVVAEARLDSDRARLETAQARVGQLEARLSVARLPDREAAIEAAEAEVAAARAEVREATAALAECRVSAPADGRIERRYLDPGEQTGPERPVVSLLPEGALKIRFHLSESRRVDFPLGRRILVDCDGCADGIPAEVTWLASEAEYTPPVIYSLDERHRLVFLAEAQPLAQAAGLLPGQPVDVRPAP